MIRRPALAGGFLFAAVLAARGATAPTETVRAAGLDRPVEIVVDGWGVPHVFAKSEHDAFFGQGFAAARDRLFQMDLWRRRGLGRLAGVFGASFVEQDRATRLFLYRGDMDREWRAYSSRGTKRAERIAQSFASGINAYIDFVSAHPERLPWEFRSFGYSPEKWAAADVVRIRSHGLTRNLTGEVARANTVCKAGLEADNVRLRLQPPWKTRVPDGLDPCLPGDLLRVFTLATQQVVLTKSPSSASGGPPVYRLAAAAAEETEGSNNWAITPRRSATGRAILANDPHRAYSAPSLRYLAHVSAPGLNVIGAGEPFAPGISLGHNAAIAFGLTIFPLDQEDLYVYELRPGDPAQYRYGAGWEAFRIVREEIPVKGGAPAAVELAFTRHGPVLLVDREKNRAYAVRSGWLEAGMSPYLRSIDFLRAKNFEQFRRSLRHWGAPTLNYVYADVAGNIGWATGGLVPRRPNWDGLLPVPGDGRYEWAGFWTGDELPSSYNPLSGYVATANQLNLPADYPYRERKIGFEWGNDSRYRRLEEVLGSLPKVSLADSKRLQNDLVAIPARRLQALLAPMPLSEGKARAAAALLRGWDAVQRPDASAPALFEVWLGRHLGKAFREAILTKEAADAIAATDLAVMLDGLEQPGTWFGADPAAASARRDEILATTLASAWAEMEKIQGTDASKWEWGRMHRNLSQHPFSEAMDAPTRAKIDVGPFPKGGGPHTPNQSSYRTADFRQTNGPSVRLVIDVGRWDESMAVNHPGQSGDPDSPHYRDLAPMWLAGDYFPLLYSRLAIERAAQTRIRLLP